MTLDEMTTLVSEAEAMDIINKSLKQEHNKAPPVKGKTKEYLLDWCHNCK